MHYSGPDSPSFSQLNKKNIMTSLPQIQTANSQQMSNLQNAHFVYSIVIK